MRRRNSTTMIVLAAAVLMAVALFGCRKGDEGVPSPPPAASPNPATPAASPVQDQHTSAKTSTAVTPNLDFAGRKDPFKPFIEPKVEKPAPAGGSLPAAGLLPIQGYAVEQFRVSGIIVGFRESKALIVDPAGKGYVVKEGMKIGNADGVITKINPSYIEVAERFRDDVTGKMTRRTVRLSLPRKN